MDVNFHKIHPEALSQNLPLCITFPRKNGENSLSIGFSPIFGLTVPLIAIPTLNLRFSVLDAIAHPNRAPEGGKT